MASYYCLVGAAFAAGVVEGSSVLSRAKKMEGQVSSLSSKPSDAHESGGVDLVIPSILYGATCLPLALVGGSPGPAVVNLLLKIPPVVVPATFSTLSSTPTHPKAQEEMDSGRIWNTGGSEPINNGNVGIGAGPKQRRMKLSALLYYLQGEANDDGSPRIRSTSEGGSSEGSEGIPIRQFDSKRRPQQMFREEREEQDDISSSSPPNATSVSGLASHATPGSLGENRRPLRLQQSTQTQLPPRTTGLQQFVFCLHDPTLPTPLAEAMRRVRLVLVGFAAMAAWVGHQNQMHQEQVERERRKQKMEDHLRRTGRSIPAVLHHLQGMSNSGVVLRLVNDTNELTEERARSGNRSGVQGEFSDPIVSLKSSQTSPAILHVLCDSWNGFKDSVYDLEDASPVPHATPYWRLGQTTEEWNEIPISEEWLVSSSHAVVTDGNRSEEAEDGRKCHDRKRYLWIEADVSFSLYDELCGDMNDDATSSQPKSTRQVEGNASDAKKPTSRKTAKARTVASLLAVVARQKGVMGKIGSTENAVVTLDSSSTTAVTVFFGDASPVGGEKWWRKKGNEVFIDSRSRVACAVLSAIYSALNSTEMKACPGSKGNQIPDNPQRSSDTKENERHDMPEREKEASSREITQQTSTLAAFDSVGRTIRRGGQWLGDALETLGSTIRLVITRFSDSPSTTKEDAMPSHTSISEANSGLLTGKKQQLSSPTSRKRRSPISEQIIHVVSPSKTISQAICRDMQQLGEGGVQWRIEWHDISDAPPIAERRGNDGVFLICGCDDDSTIDFLCSSRLLPHRVIVLVEKKQSVKTLHALLQHTTDRGASESLEVVCLEEVRDESFEELRLMYLSGTHL